MAQYVHPELVNRTGMKLKLVERTSVSIGPCETLDTNGRKRLVKEVSVAPDYDTVHELSCHEDSQGDPRNTSQVTLGYNDLAETKIVYIRCSTDGILFREIIPRGARKVKYLLGNRSGAELWVGEKLSDPPGQNLRSGLAKLGILKKSEFVKIKYYKHNSRDTRTSYEVSVSVQGGPSSPKEYTGVWEALFGSLKTGGRKIPVFQYPGVPIPQGLQIVHEPKPMFSFSRHRPLLF